MANFNLNKVILGGRMVADPELKQTPQGVSVTSFNIAVNRKPVKDKETQADFITIVAWRNTAEFICKYFKKGASICISGSVQTRSYEDKQGNKRIATEIVADEAYFVDGKSEGQTVTRDEPAFQPNQPQFENVATDDDLPF